MPEKPTPIHDAFTTIDIPDLPDNSVTVAGEVKGKDAGVSISAEQDLGKPGGWSWGAQGGWWKSTGAAVKGWLTWKK